MVPALTLTLPIQFAIPLGFSISWRPIEPQFMRFWICGRIRQRSNGGLGRVRTELRHPIDELCDRLYQLSLLVRFNPTMRHILPDIGGIRQS
jgi:hypothetical protein